MPNRREFQQRYGTGKKNGQLNTGALRKVRAAKRAEAEERNRNSAPERRRSYWRARGFTSESHARRCVEQAVNEGHVISRTIVPDLDPLEHGLSAYVPETLL